MNFLNELTIKNLKQNKKRTMVTIFGIMLSVALITAITTFVSSMQDSLIERAKTQSGNYHIFVMDVPKAEQKYLLHNVKVEKVLTGYTVGNVNPKPFFQKEEWEIAEPQMKLKAFSAEAMTQMGINPIKGKMPKDEKELLFPANLNGLGSSTYKVGDDVTLDIDGQEKTYRIAGFFLTPSFEYQAENGYQGYTFVTPAGKYPKSETQNLALLMKNPKDAYKFAKELTEKHGFSKEQVITNNQLLKFQGVARSERTMNVLYTMSAIVILIIVLTSVFVIKNSFDISITERLKQYGMLVSVGATSRQIRKNVMFEGLILGLIAIPLGILCGIFAIWVTLLGVMQILEGTTLRQEYVLTLHVSWIAIVAAVLAAALTIYISSLIPARKAAKISPIDAIRETKNIRLSNKKLRTSKVLQKLLGVEGEIAEKNLKRSRKKYRTTVFSIFLSVVLFVSISSVLKYGFMMQDMQYERMDYNLIAYYEDGQTSNEEQWKVYKNVQTLDGIKESTILKRAVKKIVNGNYTKEALTDPTGEACSAKSLDENTYIDFYAVPDEQYRAYLKEIGLSYEEAEGKAVISDTQKEMLYDEETDEYKRRQYQILDSKAGDMLSYADESKDANQKTGQIEIVKRTDKMPFGIQNEGWGEIYAIVSEKTIETMNYQLYGMKIQTDDTQKLQEEIRALDGGIDWNFTDYDAFAKENNAMVLIISIFLYGFITVISVIGITNVFNTITTNMALRSREFAILKSIGMTEKEFRKMIRYESILYGTKALACGVPVGVLLSYLLYRQFVNIVEVPYEIPWAQIGIAAVFVFLIIFLTMGYSMRKTKKQNIIETIRSENI